MPYTPFNQQHLAANGLPCVDEALSCGQVLGPSRPVAQTVGSTSCGGIGAGINNDNHAACSCARIGADSPSPRLHPIMLRSGARHPDAEAGASTSRPTDVATMYATLNEYLLLENKFQPRLCLPQESENGEVTLGARNGAAHVLRSLKVWFDLPAEVLIDAINLLDRFLTKMKVRPCHVPCITVSCMNIAIEDYAKHNNVKRNVSIDELVSISQSACTAGDVSRMCRIIADKLCAASRRVTASHWLALLTDMLAGTVPGMPKGTCTESELTNLLEIVVCDAECVNIRTSELALVLLFHTLDQQVIEWSRTSEVPEYAYYVYEFGRQVQQYCHMSDASLVSAKSRVKNVISRYEARSAQPQRQRLVWRLSERTLKVLRPTDRLTSLLPTIEEQNLAVDATPPRNRSGSESSMSEETVDWPRSPVLPVYCDN